MYHWAFHGSVATVRWSAYTSIVNFMEIIFQIQLNVSALIADEELTIMKGIKIQYNYHYYLIRCEWRPKPRIHESTKYHGKL